MSESPQRATLAEEDLARAHCYALISRLFYAPADARLLQTLGGAPSTGGRAAGASQAERPSEAGAQGGYAEAFTALQRACRSADLETLRQEYDDMFIGAGKALVTPYTSGYALSNAPDRHLVSLRNQLSTWGLARRDSVFEVEDHVSAVCDAMRWLVEGEQPLEVQRAFFEDYVYTGVGLFCDAIDANASTSFYRAAAALTRAFLEVEKEGFALLASE
jgi:TorA maturation chaperone TorD